MLVKQMIIFVKPGYSEDKNGFVEEKKQKGSSDRSKYIYVFVYVKQKKITCTFIHIIKMLQVLKLYVTDITETQRNLKEQQINLVLQTMCNLL